MILVPMRTSFASRTARHIFLIFLFHFFLSLIGRKATVCGEKIDIIELLGAVKNYVTLILVIFTPSNET